MSEIILGDCISEMKKLPDESFDCILADPPYNQVVADKWDNQWADMDEYLNWTNNWVSEAVRLLKDSGTIFLYGRAENIAHISVKFPLEHRMLVWHYKNKADNSKFWGRSFEMIICGWKDEKKRVFNLDKVREKYTDIFLKNSAGKVRKNTQGRFGNKSNTIYKADLGGAKPRDVLHNDLIEIGACAGGKGRAQRWVYHKILNESFPNSEATGFNKDDLISHPTQKPYELSKRLMLSCMPDNGKILIPFAGSHSECAVANDLGFEYTGIEIDENYHKLGKSFLEKIK